VVLEPKVNMESQQLTLKEKIFMTIEEQIPLKEFEQWLYSQAELLETLNDDLILALFTFNYTQKGAHYEFKSCFIKYFNEEEFMFWKIKANLRDLIAGSETRDRILREFYYDLGYDMYEFEDAEYMGQSLTDIHTNLKSDAQELLDEIELKEKTTTDFKIKNFERMETPQPPTSIVTKKVWWKFWHN